MKEKFEATIQQRQPKGSGSDITQLVQADIESRAEMGMKKYGERLRPYNGCNALWDAYREALGLCMYLRKVIEERD